MSIGALLQALLLLVRCWHMSGYCRRTFGRGIALSVTMELRRVRTLLEEPLL